MKRMHITVLATVFLSLTLAGCYTKLKGPEPGTGINENYYNEYPYYYDSFYNPYSLQFGWYSPFNFGFPSYYGNFYYPWWYDPYYGNDGNDNGHQIQPGKDIRTRGGSEQGTLPTVPGSSYSPPASSPGSSDTGSKPPSTPSTGNQGSSSGDDKSSGGKETRGRR
jgi:hypothetical protein